MILLIGLLFTFAGVSLLMDDNANRKDLFIGCLWVGVGISMFMGALAYKL